MRVLLADDHGIVRDGLRWMLTEEPDVDIVGEVGDGRELLDLLEERRGEVDIVLLDIRMPGLGGLEVLDALLARAGGDDPAVVILSMHGEPGYVRRAIELGAVGYLLKSVSREELLAALRHVTAGRCYLQSEVTGSLLDQVAGRTAPPPPSLTARERTVLRLVADGLANKQIGARLGISEETVKTHLKDVFARLGVVNRAEAVTKAIQQGLLELG